MKKFISFLIIIALLATVYAFFLSTKKEEVQVEPEPQYNYSGAALDAVLKKKNEIDAEIQQNQ